MTRSRPVLRCLTVLLAVWAATPAAALAASLRDEAISALDRGGGYFRDTLGVDGTYVWKYAADGSARRGEGGQIDPDVGWIQPPGTPAVGAAFLRIHEITKDRAWLEAAHRVATALVRTQLASGGWYYSVNTDPEKRRKWCYRSILADAKGCAAAKHDKEANRTVLDDNTTQSAINFLIWYDAASAGSDPAVREAISYGLKRLIAQQYPNGGFFPYLTGRRIDGDENAPPPSASLPDDWPREWQKPQTLPYFIVNDNLPRDVGRMFLNAYNRYSDADSLAAARKIGDFLLAAQLPSPQQGWAQNYDGKMQPVWGRVFEPPAVASSETASSAEYLLELFETTKDERYLDAAHRAAEWLKASRLPNGKWARFYELKTNRPLYVDNENRPTYELKNPIDHYNILDTFRIPETLARLQRADDGAFEPPPIWASNPVTPSPALLEAEVRQLLATQDEVGRWVDDGWIDGERFVSAVFTLASYVDQH